MAGNTAASNIDSFSYMAMNSIAMASINFTGQNIGAGKLKRVPKVALTTTLMAFCVGIFFGIISLLFGRNLIHIFTTTPESVEFAMKKMMYVMTTYALCGVMDCLSGCERGMGLSITPMMISLVGSCLFRIVWIYTVFEKYRTPDSLFIVYPISWFITIIVHVVAFVITYNKRLKASSDYHEKKRKKAEPEQSAPEN